MSQTVHTITTTAKPISKPNIDELILSGLAVDLILDYQPNNGGYFLIYISYNGGKMLRQVYTQKNFPRKFRDIRRGLDWGKMLGFRSVSINIDYSVFVPDKPDCKP